MNSRAQGHHPGKSESLKVMPGTKAVGLGTSCGEWVSRHGSSEQLDDHKRGRFNGAKDDAHTSTGAEPKVAP